ncbi:MAG: aspartyl protease family protein [Acidimicrobiales bacterium]
MGRQLFLVDTGAAVSNISPRLASSLHLVNAHRSLHLSAAFGCPVNLTEVKSGRWTLGSTSLTPQLVARLPASGLKIAGLLASDVLSRFGAVVIDYRAARILLESGRA